MLRCPKCNRTYQDDMQKFCTHDGGRLVPDVEKPVSFDPNATVHGDLANLDISAMPPSAAPPAARPPATDLNATLAGAPPPPQPPPLPPGYRPPDTAPTSFPQTTRLDQPSPPQHQQQQANYPPAPEPVAPQPPQPEPPPPAPVQQPPAPAQFPTMMAPPPPAANVPQGSAPMPSSAPLPSGTGQIPAQSAPLPPARDTGPMQSAPLPAAPKKSKLGLMLGIAGGVLLLVLIAGGVGAYFYMKGKKAANDSGAVVPTNPTINNNANTNSNSSVPTLPNQPRATEAPPNSVKFENSQASLDGKLKEHYVDFYFYYPQAWQKSDKAGVPGALNFVDVERKLPPDYTQENLTVSWYESKGTVEADLAGKLPALIKERDAALAKNYPEYQKVSEGKTTINGIEGYEFRFKAFSRASAKGDINIWGRIVFLPPGDEESTKGVTLYMFTTSLAPELQSIDDVGVKGELPMILNSFTLGKS